jgi:FkbM family methyltransferase
VLADVFDIACTASLLPSDLRSFTGQRHKSRQERQMHPMRRGLMRLTPSRRRLDADHADQLRKLTAEVEHYRREAACRQMIGNVIARYFIKGERTPDIAIPFEAVIVDSNPLWVPGLLDRRELTEPEFAVFRFFNGNMGTILDLGANFGYSAATIWASGSTCSILSFEPNPWHVPCLQQIKEMRAGRFDFVTLGLGNRDDSIRFVVPVIEGVGISGLVSAAIESEMDWAIPENLIQYVFEYVPSVKSPHLQFAEVVWKIRPLDAALPSRCFDVALDKIAAIKLDVDGFEAEVIEGAIETLRHHLPVLMIEGANRIPGVMGQLIPLGYRYADFQDERLTLMNHQSLRTNGFYLHESKLDLYRQVGMLTN